MESVVRLALVDWELIVVDDGSTDEMQGALAPYLNWMLYVRIDHCGPARARNVGPGLPQREYVCLLDSEDRCYLARLALQAAVLDERPDARVVFRSVLLSTPAGSGGSITCATVTRARIAEGASPTRAYWGGPAG